MAYEDVNSIRLLKNLFEQCNINKEGSSDSENEGDFPGASQGPSCVKPRACEAKRTLENLLLKQVEPEPGVQSMEEFDQQQREDEELLDTRKQPEYVITYKQAVTTEDIYLQMGMKTPATSSCEAMVIEIDLPEEAVKIDEMDLKVEAKEIQLMTPVYRLKLPLPCRVDPKKSRAEYDVDKKVLKLTLKMIRDYDFINF